MSQTGMTDPSLWNLSIIAARTAIVLALLVLGIRLFGKRTMGGTSVIDLVVVLALANAVQNAMTLGSGLLLVGIASAGTLLLIQRLLTAAFVWRPSLEAMVTGGPVVIVDKGVLDRDQLRREGITEEEVMRAVRGNGLEELAQVRLGVLEADGSISVVSVEKASKFAAKSPAEPEGET
jgi:uncharacterized membrane protein YcaP (DUF421 family)